MFERGACVRRIRPSLLDIIFSLCLSARGFIFISLVFSFLGSSSSKGYCIAGRLQEKGQGENGGFKGKGGRKAAFDQITTIPSRALERDYIRFYPPGLDGPIVFVFFIHGWYLLVSKARYLAVAF